MNPQDQTPSSIPDPQWDEIVARLRGDEPGRHPARPGEAGQRESGPHEAGHAEPGHARSGHRDAGADREDTAAERTPARPHDAPVPHEPTAAERAETLRRLFNTGPAAPGPRDDHAPDAPEQFIPPEPPALGSGNPVTTLAWVAAAGGPLGLLLCVIFFREAPTLLYGALAVATLIGIVMLLVRLPNHRDPGDDGARV